MPYGAGVLLVPVPPKPMRGLYITGPGRSLSAPSNEAWHPCLKAFQPVQPPRMQKSGLHLVCLHRDTSHAMAATETTQKLPCQAVRSQKHPSLRQGLGLQLCGSCQPLGAPPGP